MPRIVDYAERMPDSFQFRYRPGYWVEWTNALLDRLSGAGTLPPQRLTAGVVPFNGAWLKRPPQCRDVKGIRSAAPPQTEYTWSEENNLIRVNNVYFREPERREAAIIDSDRNNVVVDGIAMSLERDSLKDWLFVVTQGAARNFTFIVTGNDTPLPGSGETDVYLSPIPMARTEAPDMAPFAVSGYFVPPRDYLVMTYIAKYTPAIAMEDELDIGGRENLVDAWFRWKAEEHVSSQSQDCAYWAGRVEAELARQRAETFNHMNIPSGRSLPGFGV